MRVIDLFSGCGGLSKGFGLAGYDVQLAIDHWQPAVDTYKENFNHPIENIDLTIEDKSSLFSGVEFDMIIGGPPCQDFSSAGKRDETGGRADLTIHYANIVSIHKPQWFLMENVERITKSNTLKDALSILRDAGYGLTSTVLNANTCGVPQNRKRFFLIGRLAGVDNEMLPYLEENQASTPMTMNDYFQGSLGTEFYYRHARSYARRGIFSIHEPSPTIRGVSRPIPPNYQIHKGDACKDLSKVRPLTSQERGMIQTFPEDFVFVGTKGKVEQMIGNAVPVNLAKHVAQSINNFIEDLDNDAIITANQTEIRFETENA